MGGNLLNRIEVAFGWRGMPDGLFYLADHALRFDLGGDCRESALSLVRAMARSWPIIDEIFSMSEDLTAIVTHFGGKKRTNRDATSFRRLREIGFHDPFCPPERVTQMDADHIAEFGEDLCRYWYAAEFQKAEGPLVALLWAALGRELRVAPKARWLESVHIVDFKRKIVVCPYDDQVLDVIAPTAANLEPLYSQFNKWLQDSERAGMDAKYATLSASEGHA